MQSVTVDSPTTESAEAKKNEELYALDPALLDKARHALEQGRTNRSIKLLKKALRAYWYVGDLRAQAHHLLGVAYTRQGYYDAAEMEMLRALSCSVVEKRPGTFGRIMRDYALVFLKRAEYEDNGFEQWIPPAETACYVAATLLGRDIDELTTSLQIDKQLVHSLTAELYATSIVAGQIALAVRNKKQAHVCFEKADRLFRENPHNGFRLQNRLLHMRSTSIFKWPFLAPRAYWCALTTRSFRYAGLVTILGIPVVRWFVPR